MIDGHHHFWTLSRGDYGWITPELGALYQDFGPDDLRPLLARAGVERTVLVQAAPSVAETRFLLDIADVHEFVAGVVGWMDFADPSAPALVATLARHPKLKGLRPVIQDIPDDDWMLRPDLDPAFRAIVELDLTFDALVFPRHLTNLLRLVERHPSLRVVIDHGAKPPIGRGEIDRWAADMRVLASETPVLCKLSGLVTEDGPSWSVDRLRPYVDHLIETFGPDRLIWGSDWPVLNLVGDYASWVNASRTLLSELSHHAQSRVFGGNAVEFYRLDRT